MIKSGELNIFIQNYLWMNIRFDNNFELTIAILLYDSKVV